MAPDPQARGAGEYPYPLAQQQGITAPAGYPVHGIGSSTPAYPPQPQSAAYPPMQQSTMPVYPPQPQTNLYPPQGSSMGPEPVKKPPGYPEGGAPAGPYAPAAGTTPATGYPVNTTQYPDNAMYMEQGGVGDVAPENEKCRCSVGWVLFALGFLLWPCWVAAAFVPLCTRSRSDRLAGWASTGMMLLLVIAGIIIGATSPRWRYNNGYNNYGYYG